jgi:hypothetical protein
LKAAGAARGGLLLGLADTLYGQGNADTFLFLAASAYGAIDTIKDFSTAQSDHLDLSDLLSAYNPPTDDITHFVEITTSGSNSILKVDADGTGPELALSRSPLWRALQG